MPAERNEREDDVVAGRYSRYPFAHLLDDGGAFVAQHGRPRYDRLAPHEVQVAAADARRRDAHANLMRFRWVQLDIRDDEWCIAFNQNSRFHVSSSA